MRRILTGAALAAVAVLVLPDRSVAQYRRGLLGRSRSGPSYRSVPAYSSSSWYVIPSYPSTGSSGYVTPSDSSTDSSGYVLPASFSTDGVAESARPRVPRPGSSFKKALGAPASSEAGSAAPEVLPTPSRTADLKATVNLLVPAADAVLWVDGRKIEGTGTTRQFVSPARDAGQRSSFTFKVQWDRAGAEAIATRTVDVYPGDRLTVDFTRPSREIVPREVTEPKP